MLPSSRVSSEQPSNSIKAGSLRNWPSNICNSVTVTSESTVGAVADSIGQNPSGISNDAINKGFDDRRVKERFDGDVHAFHNFLKIELRDRLLVLVKTVSYVPSAHMRILGYPPQPDAKRLGISRLSLSKASPNGELVYLSTATNDVYEDAIPTVEEKEKYLTIPWNYCHLCTRQTSAHLCRKILRMSIIQRGYFSFLYGSSNLGIPLSVRGSK